MGAAARSAERNAEVRRSIEFIFGVQLMGRINWAWFGWKMSGIRLYTKIEKRRRPRNKRHWCQPLSSSPGLARAPKLFQHVAQQPSPPQSVANQTVRTIEDR